MTRRDWANWIGRAVLEMGIGLLFLFCAMAYGQAPFVNLTGQMTGPNGLPVANNVITFKPTQMFFIGGTNSAQEVGNISGTGAPTNPCAISGQLYSNTATTPPTVYQCIYGTWIEIFTPMVYPPGSGIPQVVGGASWGATYNAGNLVPRNFLPQATNSALGAAECDGVTTFCTSGVVSTLAPGAGFQMAVTPPTSTKYIPIYPSGFTISGAQSYVSVVGGSSSATIVDIGCNGGPPCVDPLNAKVLWTFALPSYVNPSNVTAVYGSTVASVTNVGGTGFSPTAHVDCFQSATDYVLVSAYNTNQAQGQSNVLLTGVTGAQVPTVTCSASVTASITIQGAVQLNVPTILLQVADSIDTAPASPAINVLTPLYYNGALNDLGIDPLAAFQGINVLATTVAGLPVSPTQYSTYQIRDGSTATDCTTGGGSNRVNCYWNGSTWTGTAVGGVSGFPIMLGSTSIAASSTTTAVTGLSVNGVTLNATGAATLYLDKSGNYSTPAGGGGSPGGSTTQLQYNNAGAFGGTAGITYAGTAGNLNLAATDALTGTSAGYLNEVLNGINLPSLMDQGSDHSISALAAGIAVPNTATIHQVQGLFGAVTNASTNTNAVGMYTVGICTANSTSCWGENPTVGDSPSLTGVFLIGSEIDVGINNTSTNATGLRIDGAWVAQPTTSVGIIIARTGGSTGQWGTGIQIPSGSANIGIDLGSTAKSGSPTGSQHLRFETANGLSYSPSDIYADTNGNLNLDPFGGNTTVTGNLIVSGLGGSTLPVCPHGTGNDFTTSGCLLPLSSVSAAASGSGTYDFSGATQIKLPVAAGYTSAANGEIGYDSTNKNWHGWVNGADLLMIPLAASFVSGDCGQPTSAGGSWVIADTGSPCGSGSGAVASVSNSDGTLTISPTTGSVVASIALGHANTWSGLQTFGTDISIGGVTATGAQGTGKVVFDTSPTLTTPVLGAATATSLLASGIVDGEAPVTVTTGSSATLGGTYKSGYTFNQEGTAGAAVIYTLPTAAAGLQYCVANSYNGSAADTGTLELLTSASGQFIIYTDGTLSATGGYVISGGAARDSACVVGLDSTHWMFYPSSGTWSKH